MAHFLENHYWVAAIFVFVVLALLFILQILHWRLHKIKKKYDNVIDLTNLSPKHRELIALLLSVPDHLQTEVLQEVLKLKEKFLKKRNRNLKADKDKIARK